MLIACRHVHHLYDGVLLLAVVPRSLHVVVALDWATNRWTHLIMRLVCRIALWPVILRHHDGYQSTFTAEQRRRRMYHATRDVVALLRAQRAIVMFPEGWPNIDPSWTPKAGNDDMLPFEPGFVRLVALAQRGCAHPVAIVPAGLHYGSDGGYVVTLRFGEPLFVDSTGTSGLLGLVEQRVAQLSQAL